MTARLTSALLAAALSLLAVSASPAFAQRFDTATMTDQRHWTALGDLLRAADPAYAPPAIRQTAAAAVKPDELRRALDWSAEAGILIFVPMQVSETAPAAATPLGTPVILGVGSDPFDAAAAAFKNPPYLPSGEAGMRFSPEHSFFVWVTIEHNWLHNRLSCARLSPVESVRLRDDVDILIADTAAEARSRSARILRIMAGIRARVAQRSAAVSTLGPMDTARTAYEAAQRNYDNALSSLSDWQDAARLVEGSIPLIPLYRNILTLRGLRTQVSVHPWPNLRDDLRHAKTPEDLAKALADERDRLRHNIAGLDLVTLCRADAAQYAAFVQALPVEGEDAATIKRLLAPKRASDCATPGS